MPYAIKYIDGLEANLTRTARAALYTVRNVVIEIKNNTLYVYNTYINSLLNLISPNLSFSVVGRCRVKIETVRLRVQFTDFLFLFAGQES